MAEILHQLIGSSFHYLNIYKVLYIPGGEGFLPSTVSMGTTKNGETEGCLDKQQHKLDEQKNTQQFANIHTQSS